MISGDFGECSIQFEVVCEDLLVCEFGFGEHNVPFVTFLTAGFGGFVAALRFEANFGAAPLGS